MSVAAILMCLAQGAARAVDEPNWLTSTSFTVAKSRDLSVNQEPASRGYECTLQKDTAGTPRCSFSTPLGAYSNGKITRPDGTFSLEMSDGSLLLPSPPSQPNLIMMQQYDKATSRWLLKRTEFDASKLTKVARWNVSTYYVYTYTVSGSATFLDLNGQPLSSEPSGIAYSTNGRWLGVQIRGSADGAVGGILLYDLTNSLMAPKLISTSLDVQYIAYSDIKSSNLAVSDDGRYVAYNGYMAGYKPTLRVYDTATCLNQYAYLVSGYGNNCEYNDVWNGKFRTETYLSNIPTEAAIEYPRRLRFAGDNSLLVQGVYARNSPTSFSVAEYSVSPSSTGSAPLSLLVMGDSYISGEGVKYYRSGTDTRDNKCHNSWLAYGYQRGWSHFPLDKVKSVACSGAKLNDIDAGLWAADKEDARRLYDGQTKREVKWKDRPQQEILDNFSPGYSNQIIFSENNTPRNVLLSVGGNDIGFANIITGCALSNFEGDCYNTYNQRKELMDSINSQYYGLKKTYENIKATTKGGKLYVVGYPQVAKVGGSCGANVHLNANEVKFSNDLITYVNMTIKRAASDAGVTYVDVEGALAGHRLCEAAKNNSAMNGLTEGDDKRFKPLYLIAQTGPISYLVQAGIANESYHPTALGHKILGAEIIKRTKNFTIPMPNKTNLKANTFNFTDPLINGFVPGDNDIHSVLWTQPTPSSLTVLKKGSKYKVRAPLGLDASGTVRVVQFSTPKTLYEGSIAQAEIIIPTESSTGTHTIAIYGKSTDGQSMVYKQVYYVADSDKDADGDGIDNENDSCTLVAQSNIDDDHDGKDDACDGDIDDSGILPEGAYSIPPEDNPLDEPTGADDAQDTLLPIEYLPEPTKEHEDEGITPEPTTPTEQGAEMVHIPQGQGGLRSSGHEQGVLLAFSGVASQGVETTLHTGKGLISSFQGLPFEQADSAIPQVLGARQPRSASTIIKHAAVALAPEKQAKNGKKVIVLAVASVIIAAYAMFIRKRRSANR